MAIRLDYMEEKVIRKTGAIMASSNWHPATRVANAAHPSRDADGNGEDEREQCQEFFGFFHKTSRRFMMQFSIAGGYLNPDYIW